MKTFKTTIIITAGIITAILALLSVPVKADNLEKEEMKETNESKATVLNYEELMATEQTLLQDYIRSNQIPEVTMEEAATIKIYNQDGQLVYKGLESESGDMIKMGLFLQEFAGEKIYTLP